MRAISIHRDITMRVLIITALFACASAAPSFLAPVPLTAVAVPTIAVVPTIPPGDIQAAAIDAQVKLADEAQMQADRARALAELAAENQHEGEEEANDLTKEKTEEAFWVAEEQKYQAMNEAQIAEAKMAAVVAENTDALIKPDSAAIVPGVEAAAPAAESIAVDTAAATETKSEEVVKSEAISENIMEEKEPLTKSTEDKSDANARNEKSAKLSEDLSTAIENALKAQNLALQAYNLASIPVARVLPGVVSPAAVSYQSVAPFSYHVQHIPASIYSPPIAFQKLW